MNIGIIVYSQTGNTLKVCEKLKTELDSAGLNCSIEKVESSGDSGGSRTDIKITNAPDALKYDALVFAAPVQAFSLAMPMNNYMKTLSGLNGKKAAFITTKGLPFKWTGANHALSQMSKLARAAGAEAVSDGAVIWPGKNPDAETIAAAGKFKEIFK